jgi:hypothetical protein
MERSKNFWTIYDAAKEGLMNQLQNVQRLEEEGHSMGSLKEEIEEKIRVLVENDDRHMCKRRLGQLRKELTHEEATQECMKIKDSLFGKKPDKEVIIGC